MGLKDRMMERMIDKMSKEEKQEMMDKMMGKFFTSMTKNERKEMMATMMPKMMDNMFKGMSAQEKQEIMMAMMPKMMSQMFGGGMGGIKGMMQGKTGKKSKAGKAPGGADKPEVPEISMMEMMAKCMSGEVDPPWISMGNAFKRAMDATEYSLLSTKEIQKLFKEWVKSKNRELLKHSQETSNPKELAKKMEISESSLYFLLCKLAQDDKINLIINRRKEG